MICRSYIYIYVYILYCLCIALCIEQIYDPMILYDFVPELLIGWSPNQPVGAIVGCVFPELGIIMDDWQKKSIDE